MNKKVILVVGLCIAIISIAFFWDDLQTKFIRVFKLDTELKTFDNQQRLHGRYRMIKDGMIVLEGNYIHGSAEGIFKRYYEGKIKEKTFYKNNKIFGANYGYYENGNLNYKIYNLNGLYGDSFHYDEDGRMDVYGVNDIEHSFFYYSNYKNMVPVDVIGTIFSENIYSYNKETGAEIILKNKEKIRNISDLFITVARPPQLSLEINVSINGRKWSKNKFSSSTILLKNIFDKAGEYNISIDGELKDKDGNSFKKDSLHLIVTKI